MGRSKSLQAPWQSNAPADIASRDVGNIFARCPLALAYFTQVTHWRCWSRAQAVPRMVQGDPCSQDPRNSQLEEETQATPASFLRCQRAPATRGGSFVWVSLCKPQKCNSHCAIACRTIHEGTPPGAWYCDMEPPAQLLEKWTARRDNQIMGQEILSILLSIIMQKTDNSIKFCKVSSFSAGP